VVRLVNRSDLAELADVPGAKVIGRELGEQCSVIIRILPLVTKRVHHESFNCDMREALIQ
jgi:hypothetical protein